MKMMKTMMTAENRWTRWHGDSLDSANDEDDTRKAEKRFDNDSLDNDSQDNDNKDNDSEDNGKYDCSDNDFLVTMQQASANPMGNVKRK